MKSARAFIFILALGLIVAGGAFAQSDCPPGTAPGSVCIGNPLKAATFADLIDGIINFLFTISFAIVPIMVIVGGFMFVTGGGDPKKITQGKQLLLWTAVGFIVILISKGLVAVIRETLEVKIP